MKKKIFLVVFGVIIIYGMAFTWALFHENSFVFPYANQNNEKKTSPNLPDSLNLTQKKISLKKNNQNINAWVLPAKGENLNWVIFCHGTETDMSSQAHFQRYKIWHKLNLNVLVFDYLGYGESDGNVSENGMYESAKTAYDYLSDSLDVDEDKILLYGEGLGSTVALDLAQKMNGIGGVILENGVLSTKELFKQSFPLMPVQYFFKTEFDAKQRAMRVYAPKLFFYAKENTNLPNTHAIQLSEMALPMRKLVGLSGDQHSAPRKDALNYQRAISKFMEECEMK